MKNTNKKIITSLLTLVLTIVALGTTTFAWFSLSTVSNVSNISGTITAGDGLEIRLTARKTIDGEDKSFSTEWKSNLSQTDVQTFMDEIFAEERLAAVTASTLGTFTKSGLTNKGNILIGDDAATANQDYIKFTVEFKSQQEGTVALTELTFDNAETATATFTPDGSPYLQYQSSLTEANLPVVTSAANGARVGVKDTTFQYKGTEITAGTEITGNTVMGTTSITEGQYSYLTTGKGLTLYSDAAEATQKTSGTMIEAHTSVMDEANHRVEVELIQDSGAGDYLGSMVVYIWIEGWDADTYDSIYDLKLVVSLKFEKIGA